MQRRHWIGVLALFLLVLGLVAGTKQCDRGVQRAPSLIEQAGRRQGAGPQPGAARPGYVKREGLHIDIPYLGGRRLAEIPPDAVADQLGARISSEELPEDEEHLVYDKADVWTHDGRIYRIRKPLAHPMDVPTALGTSGFPLDLGTAIDATTEVRWNNTWNQRRIRLVRDLSDERLYVAIDVWHSIPKER